MSRRGIDTAALSKATGLGTATINSLRRGVGNPTLSTMIELAQFFKISLSELTETDLAEQGIKSSKTCRIPLIKINEVNKFLSGSLGETETYTTEIDDPDGKMHFAVVINNDSLYPQFSAGSIFIIVKDETPCEGDLVLIKIGTHTPCFRRVFLEGDHYLFSLIHVENDVAPSIYENYQLIGVVSRAIKNFSEK